MTMIYSVLAYVYQSQDLHRQAVYLLDTFHWARYLILFLSATGLMPFGKASTIMTAIGFDIAALVGGGFNSNGWTAVWLYTVIAWALWMWNENNGKILVDARKKGYMANLQGLRIGMSRCGFTSLEQLSAVEKPVVSD
jgi:hypothetical protein